MVQSPFYIHYVHRHPHHPHGPPEEDDGDDRRQEGTVAPVRHLRFGGLLQRVRHGNHRDEGQGEEERPKT